VSGRCVWVRLRQLIGAEAAAAPEGEDVMVTQSELHDAGEGKHFQTVSRGYDTRQVDEYIAQLRERISGLQAELEVTRRALSTTGGGSVVSQQQTDSQHEGVSVRVAQILRLADEEAQQTRVHAAEHATAVIERAQAEARDLLEAAQSTAEELLRAAMRRAGEEVARGASGRLPDH
jgi:DivIVA domain-containing protein